MNLPPLLLKDLVSITAGHSFRGKIKNTPGSGITVVQLRDVSPESGITWETCQETELVKANSGYWLEKDDILIVARGKHFYATLITQIELKAVASLHFYILRIKNKMITSEFLTWFINQKPAQSYFTKQAEGSRTLSIKKESLSNLLIPIPDLAVQSNISNLNRTINEEQTLFNKMIQSNISILSSIAEDLVHQKS